MDQAVGVEALLAVAEATSCDGGSRELSYSHRVRLSKQAYRGGYDESVGGVGEFG